MDRLEEEAKLSLAKNDLMPIMRVVRAFTKLESILQTAEIVNSNLATKKKRTDELTSEIVSLEEKKAGLESAVGALQNKEAKELETAIKNLRSDLSDVTAKYNEKGVEEREVSEKLISLRAEVARITTRLAHVI